MNATGPGRFDLGAAKLQSRECQYFVAQEAIAALPAFDPKTGDNYFPSLKALSVAFERYFSKHGVSSEEFYPKAKITMEKVDDYTASALAQSLRLQTARVRSLWFYVVTFGDLDYGETQPWLAPVLILMDGTLVFAKARLKTMP